MNSEITDKKLTHIIDFFRNHETELEHVEFKRNLSNETQVAKTISGITNVMALMEYCPRGYFIWGIDDKTHAIVGTEFKPHKVKIGNEELPL